MTSSDYRTVIALNWMEKATSTIEIAELCIEKNNLISCVNRMYYAAFYAISAVMAKEGKEYGKHTAVRSVLNRDFVKTGRIPAELGDYYNRLFDDRLAGDYEPTTSFNLEEVNKLLILTRKFANVCSTLIKG